MKRFSLITLFLLTTLLPIFAAVGDVIDSANPKDSNLVFTVLDEDAKTVSVKAKRIDYYGPDSILNIPASVTNSGDTYTVTTIAADGFKKIQIKQILLPATIKKIDTQAFREITTTFTIELNEGLEEIGNRVFCRSTGLTGTLVLPSTLKNIYSSAAFLNISIDSLIVKSIVPPIFTINEVKYPIPNVPIVIPCNTYDAYAQAWKTYTSQFVDPYRFTDGSYTYQVLTEDDSKVAVRALVDNEIQNIVLPSEVINPYNKQSYVVSIIADNCFKNNAVISSVVLPNSIVSIGKFAFYNCKNLQSISLNEGLETIGAKAFAHDSLVTGTLTIPSSVSLIDSSAFYNFIKIEKIEVLSETPPTIGLYAFFALPSNVYIWIPCNTYDKYAKMWRGYKKLLVDPCVALIENVYYSMTDSGSIVIGYDTLPKALVFKEEVTINEKTKKVISIANKAFDNVKTLTSVTIPSTIRYLGDNAFRNCTNLSSLNLNEGVEIIGDSCFYKCAFSSIITPSTLKSIGNYAFRDNTQMTTILFNEGLETIGERSFTNNSNLTETLIIPSSVTKIGASVFTGCNKLTHVYLRGSIPPQVNADTYPVFGSASKFIIPCGAMDSYQNANYWKDLSSKFISACKPLTLKKGEALIQDTIVSSIAFSRTFPMNLWQELYLPFEMDSMLLFDDGYWNAFYPFNSDSAQNGGYFYLYGLKEINMATGIITFQEEHELKAHTPYLILFVDKHMDYFKDREIVFKSKRGEYTLKDNYIAPTLDENTYQLFGNETLWNHGVPNGFKLSSTYSKDNGIYNYDFHFNYADTAELPPFSWVVTPTMAIQSMPSLAPRFLSGRWGNQPSSGGGDTPTSMQTVSDWVVTYTQTGSQLTLYTQGQPCKVYAIDGTLLLSTYGSQEEVSIELDKGMYIIYSNGHSQKVLF